MNYTFNELVLIEDAVATRKDALIKEITKSSSAENLDRVLDTSYELRELRNILTKTRKNMEIVCP